MLFRSKDFLKKLMKDQTLKINSWWNKSNEKYNTELYDYVSRMYEKIMKRCPLYKQLYRTKRIEDPNFKQFMKINKKRDALGRNLKLKTIKNVEKSRLEIRNNFSYLSEFALKKILLLSIANKDQRMNLFHNNFMESNFKFKLQKLLYKSEEEAKVKYIMPQPFNSFLVSEFPTEEIDSRELGVNSFYSSERTLFQYAEYFSSGKM